MKIFGKNTLKLKERRYRKRDVILKEDDTVRVTDTSGMLNALNKDGDATVTNQQPRKTVDVPILTKNNKVTPQDLKNSDTLQDALNVAKTQPIDVEVTANKVNGTVTPINNTNTQSQVAEMVITKRRLNNYLRNL